MEDWITFTKRERIGILGWAILCGLILSAPYIYRNYIKKQINFEDAYSSEIIEFEKIQEKKLEAKKAAKQKHTPKNKVYKPKFKTKDKFTPVDSIRYFAFDPNTISKEKLGKLGLSNRVINTLMKFRSKGGKFFQKEDLKLIYGLDEIQYDNLEPFITIKKVVKPKKSFVKHKYPEKTEESEKSPAIASAKKPIYKPRPKIDINTASIEEFDGLYGIGPTLSKRIDRYRNSLGGFYDINQIAEVYNLPDSTFQNIKVRLTITPIVKKKDLNSLDIPQLAAHPYLSRIQAGKLITHRDHEEIIKNWEEVQTILKITPKEVDRLQQYFLIRNDNEN